MQEKLEKEPYFQSIYFFVKGTPLLMLTPQSCMECLREPLLIEQEGLHNGVKINMEEHFYFQSLTFFPDLNNFMGLHQSNVN